MRSVRAGPPGSPLPDLLTAQEVADRLRVSKRTAQRLMAEGKFPTVQISPRITRVNACDLDEFMAAQRVPAVRG